MLTTFVRNSAHKTGALQRGSVGKTFIYTCTLIYIYILFRSWSCLCLINSCGSYSDILVQLPVSLPLLWYRCTKARNEEISTNSNSDNNHLFICLPLLPTVLNVSILTIKNRKSITNNVFPVCVTTKGRERSSRCLHSPPDVVCGCASRLVTVL